MTSILTNASAMTALKVLRQTESALGTTQERISTGLKVNSAKDDASTWAISQGIKSDVSTFKTISEGLTMASSALDTAGKAATLIKAEITKLQQNITNAQAPGADKAAIQDAIDSSLSMIANISQGASFNGTNLVQGTDQLRVLSSISRDASGTATPNFINVDRYDLTMGTTGGLAMLTGLNVSDDALATNASAGKSQLAADLVANAGAAGKLSFSYTSSSGEAKTVTLDYANGATRQSVGENFVATFGDALKADGIDVVTANDGKLTFTSTATNAEVGQVAAGAGFLTATQASQATLDFGADANPEVGKEFSLNVTLAGKDYGYKLRVVDATTGGATGAVLGVDDKGNKIIAVNKGSFTNGTSLGAQLATALTTGAATEFAAAPTAALFGVTSVAGKLVVTSATTTNGTVPARVNNFQQPTADFANLQATIDAAAEVATSAAQAFGTAQAQAASQKEFLSAMVDSLETGVGALIDADITAESARLNALQTQQQLATQSLSIANESTQNIMTLFR